MRLMHRYILIEFVEEIRSRLFATLKVILPAVLRTLAEVDSEAEQAQLRAVLEQRRRAGCAGGRRRTRAADASTPLYDASGATTFADESCAAGRPGQ
jgi:hypothetical protein